MINELIKKGLAPLISTRPRLCNHLIFIVFLSFGVKKSGAVLVDLHISFA